VLYHGAMMPLLQQLSQPAKVSCYCIVGIF